jgi:hypothetical protein
VLLAAASAGLLAGLPFVRPAGRRLGVTGAIVAGFAVMATGNLLTAAAPWLAAAAAAGRFRVTNPQPSANIYSAVELLQFCKWVWSPVFPAALHICRL